MKAAGADRVELVTAVVAWLALVVSCVSLIWQVASFSKSGPRVWTWIGEGEGHPADDRERHFYVVGVVNRGRQAVTINELGIRAIVDRGNWCICSVGEDVTPKKLEPGEELIVEVDRDKCAFPVITKENRDRTRLFTATLVWGDWLPDHSPRLRRWWRYFRFRLRRSDGGIPFIG